MANLNCKLTYIANFICKFILCQDWYVYVSNLQNQFYNCMKINEKSFTLKNLIFKTYMLGVGGGVVMPEYIKFAY